MRKVIYETVFVSADEPTFIGIPVGQIQHGNYYVNITKNPTNEGWLDATLFKKGYGMSSYIIGCKMELEEFIEVIVDDLASSIDIYEDELATLENADFE